MAAQLTEVRANMTSLPQPGSRTGVSSRARDAFFASFSRELRWSLDLEGRFLLLEGAWQSVLGWQPDHLHGWYWEEIVHPADRDRVGAILSRVRQGEGCERDIDVRLAVPTGGHRLTSWTFVAGAGPDSVLGLGHDRTDPPVAMTSKHAPVLLERRNAELAARLTELEERYVAVERFAGTAAHQLAEPLVIAESSAILVAEELGTDLDPMLRGRLDAIGRGAARARRLMDALLADARTDGRTLDLCTVDLAAVVEETLASLDHQVRERNATIVTGQLPHVHGEPGLLSVVLENLVSNALKYGPRTGGRVVIASEPGPNGPRISVVSEGMPIPKEEAERIFQPFHRASGERRVPGVGLGLTICSRLVERLGGAIGVEPGAESGNTFWIEVPAAVERSA
jgi:PAS domain S-box-containing protein